MFFLAQKRVKCNEHNLTCELRNFLFLIPPTFIYKQFINHFKNIHNENSYADHKRRYTVSCIFL